MIEHDYWGTKKVTHHDIFSMSLPLAITQAPALYGWKSDTCCKVKHLKVHDRIYSCTRNPGHTGPHECSITQGGKMYSAGRWYTSSDQL